MLKTANNPGSFSRIACHEPVKQEVVQPQGKKVFSLGLIQAQQLVKLKVAFPSDSYPVLVATGDVVYVREEAFRTTAVRFEVNGTKYVFVPQSEIVLYGADE